MLTAFTLPKGVVTFIFVTTEKLEISKKVWTPSTVMPVIVISYRFM